MQDQELRYVSFIICFTCERIADLINNLIS